MAGHHNSICPERVIKFAKSSCQNSRFQGQFSNPGPSRYEAWVSTVIPCHSVKVQREEKEENKENKQGKAAGEGILEELSGY